MNTKIGLIMILASLVGLAGIVGASSWHPNWNGGCPCSKSTTSITSTTTSTSTITSSSTTLRTTTIIGTTTIQPSKGGGGISSVTGGLPCYTCFGNQPVVYWYDVYTGTVWVYSIHYGPAHFVPENGTNQLVQGPTYWALNNTGISMGDWK